MERVKGIGFCSSVCDSQLNLAHSREDEKKEKAGYSLNMRRVQGQGLRNAGLLCRVW